MFLGTYPITPASDVLHELVEAQGLRRHDVPGRGRDRGHRRGAGRGVRRRAGRHLDVRAGCGAQVRDDRPGGGPRAAAADPRRAARRAVDRSADQDRAGRPAAGDVRAQRRGAGADHRAAVARGLLRRRARGGADRADLPHAGVPALRRLDRQRLRAVERARRRRRCPTCRSSSPPSPTPPTGPASSGPTCATPTPWPARGRPGHAGARAPHRRPGEGRRARHDLLRPGQPRPDGPAAPGQDRRHPGAGPRRSTTRRRRRGAGPRLGLVVRPDRRGLSPRAGRGHVGGPGAPAPPQPDARATSATCCARTAGSWCRR